MERVRGIFRLTMVNLQLEDIILILDDIMSSNNAFTDKEYNSIRETHDSIASAHDAIERLTKQKSK